VIDLTHPENVALFRAWDQTEVAYIQMLRCIRISSSKPDVALVSRPGKHVTLVPPKPKATTLAATNDAMDEDVDEAPELIPMAGTDTMR
jgi:translation machinery-associated protein 16